MINQFTAQQGGTLLGLQPASWLNFKCGMAMALQHAVQLPLGLLVA